MNSKRSATNLHTFGQDNPFIRDRSLSSLSKRSSQYSSHHNNNNQNNQKEKEKIQCYGTKKQYMDDKEMSTSKYRLGIEYGKVLKDCTNLQQSARQSYGLKHSSYLSSKHTAHFQSSSKQLQPPSPSKIPVSLLSNSPNSSGFNQDSIIYLLQNQSQSLSTLKQTITKDKQRLQRDFQDLKQSMGNTIDDFKLTLSAQLDSKYQQFVNVFKWIKNQYKNYSTIKNKYWNQRKSCINSMQNDPNFVKYPGMVNTFQQIDNQMLLKNVIDDIKDCKKHIDYTQFSAIQDKLLRPLLESASNLTRKLRIQSYYRPEIAHNTLKIIQQNLQVYIHKMYDQFDNFLELNGQSQNKIGQQNNLRQSPIKELSNSTTQFQKNMAQFRHKSQPKQKQIDRLRLSKQQQILIDQPYAHTYPHNNNNNAQVARTQSLKQKQRYNSTAHSQFVSSYSSTNSNGNKFRQSSDYVNEQTVNKGQSYDNYHDSNSHTSRGRSSSKQNHHKQLCFNNSKGMRKEKSNHQFDLDSRTVNGLNQGNVMLEVAQSILDRGFGRKQKASQTALCLVYLKPNRIAAGTKDGVIKIFCTLTGSKLNQFYGHKASICSLTTLQNSAYIVSGGDIGCCQVIIWDNVDNKIYHNFTNPHPHTHKAAITSLLDLGDNKHMVSGSFDCCINIYNYKKKQIVKSVETGEKITALAKISNNSSKGKSDNNQLILSGNLNSQVCIWKIIKNCFNSISGLQMVRSINIGTYPYSIVPMNGCSDEGSNGKVMVTGKDQWIRVINLEQGSIEEVKKVQNCTQIIQIPLQNCRNDCLYLACHKNGTITTVPHRNPIQSHRAGQGSTIVYNCGISPRSAVSNNNNNQQQIFMVNHTNQQNTQIKVWNIIANNHSQQQRQNNNLYSY